MAHPRRPWFRHPAPVARSPGRAFGVRFRQSQRSYRVPGRAIGQRRARRHACRGRDTALEALLRDHGRRPGRRLRAPGCGCDSPRERCRLLTRLPDPTHASGYAENAARMVPGMSAIPKLAAVLLAERAPPDARILVLGAGGGLELKAFADMQPGWRFDGVDPSAEMLQVATKTLGPLASRARLHEGYIDSAPLGPFDGATCLLTLHFLPRDERLETLKHVRLRLRSGAPLIVVHHSLPNEG